MIASTRRHILYLIDELSIRGGTEKSLLALASSMAARGWRVSVRSLSEGDYAEEFRDHPAFDYECLGVKRIYDISGLRALARLQGYLRREKVAILQTLHTGADLLGPLAARLSGAQLVTISSRRDLGFTKSPRHLRAQKKVNRWVDAILANSRAVKEAIATREGYPGERIEIIHNGINLQPYRRLERTRHKHELTTRLALPAEAILVGSVGNLTPVKGQRYLLEAAATLCREFPRLYFLVAGQGPQHEKLVAFCHRERLAGRVLFLGNIAEIPSFLSALDIYVQPSLSEGFSNAILEAMAAGCPIVATRVGGTEDALDQGLTGLLVRPGHGPALATAIARLLADRPLRARIASAGQQKCFRAFGLESMSEHYCHFYQKLAARRNIAC